MEKSTSIDVVVLMDDLRDIREISNVFRKIGIVSYFYQDLKKFWEETLGKTPALCIVDVKKMSDGNLLLKNHPHVKTGILPLVFFYSKDTRPLLASTFDFFHLGVMRKEISYQGQIKSILRRLNVIMDLQVENGDLKAQNEKLDSKIAGMIGKVGIHREKKYYWELLDSICQCFEKSKSLEDFFTATTHVISSCPEFLEFVYLELGYDGKRLVSPKDIGVTSKYKEIPSLWIEKSCGEGIEPFAQNMAGQVCIDLIGGDLISLLVRGQKKYPDVMIFIRTANEDFLNKFNWGVFENYLSGIYAYFQVKNTGRVLSSKKYLGPWEFLSELDQSFYTEMPTKNPRNDEKYLIDINLSKLLIDVRSSTTLQIHWKNFFNDFIGRFEALQEYNFKLTCMSITNIGFLVDAKIGNDFFRDLKMHTARFPYWRYFDGLEGTIPAEIRPTVRMVPLLSEAYLKHIEGESESTSMDPFVKRSDFGLLSDGKFTEISKETLGEL